MFFSSLIVVLVIHKSRANADGLVKTLQRRLGTEKRTQTRAVQQDQEAAQSRNMGILKNSKGTHL